MAGDLRRLAVGEHRSAGLESSNVHIPLQSTCKESKCAATDEQENFD